MDQVNYFDDINGYNQKIDLRDALQALMLDTNFKLILREYTEKLPVELTKLLGTLEKNENNKDNLTRRLEAIGLFQSFLEAVITEGDEALASKLDLESNNQDNHS